MANSEEEMEKMRHMIAATSDMSILSNVEGFALMSIQNPDKEDGYKAEVAFLAATRRVEVQQQESD